MGIWVFCSELLLLTATVPAGQAGRAGDPSDKPASEAAATAIVPPSATVFVDLSRAVQARGNYRRAPDGLFYVDAMANGVPVLFLVDTGANSIVLTASDALRAGVVLGDSNRELAATAGGMVPMNRGRLASLAAGPARREGVEVAVVGEGLAVSLLGQSWLSQFRQVTIAGDLLTIEP